MRLYTCENKEMFYAKEIFYNSISEYQKASGEGRREMVEMIKKKMKERLHWNYGIDDCYTIASRWFIRLENYLNKTV